MLLHVGLPKTATSSLQHNVLLPLHEQRRIHLLAPILVRDAGDPFASVFEQIRARRLSEGKLARLVPQVEKMLDPRRLNVISNESITSLVTLSRSFPHDVTATLDNLGRLRRGADVTVLITLRAPVDFVFSCYVHEHWWARDEAGYATMKQFCQRVLEHDGGDERWMILHYDAYLRAVSRHFGRVRVLLYEDLEHDPASYFRDLAACLGADAEEIVVMFGRARRNAGTYTECGKLSPRFTAKEVVRKRLPGAARLYKRYRSRFRRFHPLKPGYRLLARWNVGRRVEHRRPDEVMADRLRRRLGMRDDYLAHAHGVSREKLARYGYLVPPAPGPS